MPSVISPRTYEKLKKVFKDEEALVDFLEDLNKEFERLENISIQQKESIENNLYSRLVQKLPTKEELQSEIKRLEDKIGSLENKIEGEIKRLENKIETESKRLEAKVETEIKRLENKIVSESKRLEIEIRRLEDKIILLEDKMDLKFKIVIGLIILGFTLFNPNFITILKMILSLFK